MIDKTALKNCKRILILGSPGTGKSTFAKYLGEKLNLETMHLDKYYHKPGWEERDKDEFYDIVKELITKERWVIDGNYKQTLSMRIALADLIFIFDYPSYFCVYRVLKRSFKTNLGLELRTDVPDGCYEKWINPGFLKFTWNYRRDYLTKGNKILEESGFDKSKILCFKNCKQFKSLYNELDKFFISVTSNEHPD